MYPNATYFHRNQLGLFICSLSFVDETPLLLCLFPGQRQGHEDKSHSPIWRMEPQYENARQPIMLRAPKTHMQCRHSQPTSHLNGQLFRCKTPPQQTIPGSLLLFSGRGTSCPRRSTISPNYFPKSQHVSTVAGWQDSRRGARSRHIGCGHA